MTAPQLNFLFETAGSLSDELERARYAENTRKGYASDWKLFSAWCRAADREPLPATPESVRLYLIDLLRRGRKILTAERRLSAIAHYHREGKHEFKSAGEEARDLLNLAKRYRPEQPRQMTPLLVPELRKITRALCSDGSDLAVRNRALLVLGLGSALRRCNLADLTLADVEITAKGVLVSVRKEKNDQTGRGRVVGLPRGRHAETCPVRSLRAWLDVRGKAAGPLFTRPGTLKALRAPVVAQIVKEAVASIGLDPTRYAGHSLRAGFVTAAAESGAGELVIASQTGHKNMTVLRRYFRRQDIWRSNAAAMIGL